MLRYRLTQPDGRRSERTAPIGLVRDFPKEKDAWREVDRLGLHVRINDESADTRIRFDALAEHYLKADFGSDAVRPKSVNTIPIVGHYVRDYLIERWGSEIAENIKPLELQRWLKSLHDRLDDHIEDSGHYASHLQGRHPARTCIHQPRRPCRDAR